MIFDKLVIENTYCWQNNVWFNKCNKLIYLYFQKSIFSITYILFINYFKKFYKYILNGKNDGIFIIIIIIIIK